MDWLIQLCGVGLIGLIFADAFLTVLYPRSGKSMLSLQVSKGIWACFRQLARLPLQGSERILSYCGPTVLLIVIVLWVCSLAIGFALLVWPALGKGIQASAGQTPTDFAAALYYSGFALTTLGVGDLVPKTAFWRLMTVLEAAVGFSIITATITYLLSVYSALMRRNIFALSLYHRSANQANAAAILVGLKGFGQFELATQDIAKITRDLLFLLESHHAYPVLHYFRFREAHYSLARMTLVSLDLVTLIKTALHPQVYSALIHSSAVTELEHGGLDLLQQMAASFLSERHGRQSDRPEQWRNWYYQAIAVFQDHGIKTVTDIEAGADRYVALRHRWQGLIMAFAHYMDYSWRAVAPAEFQSGEAARGGTGKTCRL